MNLKGSELAFLGTILLIDLYLIVDKSINHFDSQISKLDTQHAKTACEMFQMEIESLR